MRVAFFNYHHDITGSARGAAAQLRSLTRALERRGHRVDLLFRSAAKERLDPAQMSGVKQRRHPLVRRFAHVPRLLMRNVVFLHEELQILESLRPDVVLAVHQYCNIAPLLASRRKGIPFVLFVETPMVYEYSLFYRQYHAYPAIGGRIERYVVDYADAVVCVSEILKGYLVGGGASAVRIHVIPNGVDATCFRPQPPDAGVVNRLRLWGKMVVGFVGTFQFFPPVGWFVDVAETVFRRVPQVVFLMVGSGEPAECIRREALRRGVERQFRFTGPLDHAEIPAHLSVMHVTVCPYRGDYLFYGSALKPLEYMAAGRALVAPRLGQIKELVHHGTNGILYDWDDGRAMSTAIIALLEDADLRDRLGRNARRAIEQGWTWDIQAARLETVLKEAAQRRR